MVDGHLFNITSAEVTLGRATSRQMTSKRLNQSTCNFLFEEEHKSIDLKEPARQRSRLFIAGFQHPVSCKGHTRPINTRSSNQTHL